MYIPFKQLYKIILKMNNKNINIISKILKYAFSNVVIPPGI